MLKKMFVIIAVMVMGTLLTQPHGVLAGEGHGGGHGTKQDAGEVLAFAGQHAPLWKLKAFDPLLIGGYGDNFSYDGSRVVPLIGKARAVFDADKDRGTAIVKVKGTINPEKNKTYSGEIMLVYRVGKTSSAYQEGGVADFVYLHGDTKQDAPVMPKTRTYLGAWGTVDVYVNGRQIYKNLMGHVMYTERTRDLQTWAIYNRDRSGFYTPKDPANGSVAAADGTELHFVAHSMEKDKGNFPPNAVWIHLNFGTVIDKTSGCTCGKCGAGCGCGQASQQCGAGCGCGQASQR